MSQETIRCHFNTRDAKLLQSDNNADALFPLRHLSFDAMNDEILSVASIKSVLPDSISSVRVDEDNAILEIIATEPATAPAVTATPLKLFITKSEVVLPEWNATTQITNFKSPLRYINSIQDLINIINRMLSSRIQGGAILSALSYTATNGILSLTDNSHKISFNNNYFVKSLLSPLYQKSNEIMANWLGINKDTAEPLTTLGQTEVNRELSYKVNMNHAPLYLVCRLGLDSVSSKRETLQNNIITSIPIHLGYQSFLTKIDIETVTPPPAIPPPTTYTLTVANHPYTPALNGDYISVGSLYRDNSPPRYFKESLDHHLFRMDTATNTYLLFSYGIHQTATWYIGIYPLLSTTVDYLNNNHTTLGQLSQHSIGLGWNAFTGGGIGHYPSAAYTPSHTLVGVYA